MKNLIIKIVKYNPVLYKIAKKIYRTLRPAKETIYQDHDYNITYTLNAKEEMPLIINHYNSIKKSNTHLVILVVHNQLLLHTLMREYRGITFLSLDYLDNYSKKINLENIVIMDYHSHNKIMNYI